MPVSKKFIKTRKVFKVSFEVDANEIPAKEEVKVLGDFNNWNWDDAPVLKKKKANYAVQVELAPGASYEYRYCLENKYWFNDVAADKYVASPYSDAENCVLDLERI